MVADDTTAGGRNTALVASGILLSRLSGLVRQRVVGHFFGVSAVMDAFTAAFRIPNLVQNLLGEGTLSASFIPVYSRLLGDGRSDEARRLAGAVVSLVGVAAGGIALLIALLADPVTSVIAPGLDAPTHDLTVSLTRIIAPGIALLSLSAWALGILNSHGRFFLSYAAPVVWNGTQIALLTAVAVVVLDSPLRPESASLDDLERLVHALALGTLVGALLQFLVQLPAVLRLVRPVRLSLRRDENTRRVLRAFGPVVLGRGIVQVTSFVELILASLLVEGAIAALFIAQQLHVLPISLFGLSVAAAELPALSRAEPDPDDLRGRLEIGLRRIAFFVVPTLTAYVVFGDLLVGALYQTGAFGRADTLLVWLVLAALAVGLLPSTTSRLMQSSLFAVGETRLPARLSVIRVVIALAVGAGLMLQFDRFAVTVAGDVVRAGALPAFGLVGASEQLPDGLHLGAVGLALGSALGAWVEWWLLRRAVARRLDVRPRVGAHRRSLLIAAAVVAAIGLAGRTAVGSLHPIPAALLVGSAAGLAWLGTCRRLGVPEAQLSLVRLLVRAPAEGTPVPSEGAADGDQADRSDSSS
ncbi:MAG: murein biosynthesis integral membrane protein MurJ [Nitriliruptorales bacterium]|nr:murein biosynthesis integral membrane protein MurJ [Nitriliruptorales bacterium]